ncbi:MFS transporter [Pseudonocardia halophobica]|uniref:MFS transporter n=1 Tax=Pseudonocardia halophobica TaxID=29401 RepID=A0A9W6L2C9_9PSEU|nr:MFS transporter [Pseudonocardia halophobica]GLL09774.1 MFS transporter [Pseudonocardia halophobica]
MTHATPTEPPAAHGRRQPSLARLLTASAAGTVVETYDIILTALVASLVFNHAFFPDIAPWIGTLAALGAAAIAYVGRPLGAIIFGWFGDKYSRLLALRVSILGTGVATVAIGVIPTAATIGVWAPVLLVVLRLIQGISLGGEFGGATLVAMENAPPKRRFFYGTFASVGSMGGVALATIVVLVVTSAMGMETFREWGWRVPFIASVLLIVVAYVARRIDESAEFVEAKAAADSAPELAKDSSVDGLSVLKRAVLVLAGIVMTVPTVSITYSLSTGMLPLVNAGGLPGISVTAYQIALVMLSLVAIPISLYGGWLGTRYRPELIIRIGAVWTAVAAFPVIWLLQSGSTVLLFVGMLLATPGYALVSGPAAAFVASALPVRLRYLGIGIAYAGAALVGGGVLPIVALAIAGEGYRTVLPFACILCGAGLVALFATVFTKRAQQAVARSAGLDDDLPEAASVG